MRNPNRVTIRHCSASECVGIDLLDSCPFEITLKWFQSHPLAVGVYSSRLNHGIANPNSYLLGTVVRARSGLTKLIQVDLYRRNFYVYRANIFELVINKIELNRGIRL